MVIYTLFLFNENKRHFSYPQEHRATKNVSAMSLILFYTVIIEVNYCNRPNLSYSTVTVNFQQLT